jgi:hypothetical protein
LTLLLGYWLQKRQKLARLSRGAKIITILFGLRKYGPLGRGLGQFTGIVAKGSGYSRHAAEVTLQQIMAMKARANASRGSYKSRWK